MKIKIDSKGHLWLERTGKMRKVFCPITKENDMPCGDWCALWKEHQREDDKGVWGTEIQLCKTYHICKIEDFTDEREREE